jgi:hypothetical protein
VLELVENMNVVVERLGIRQVVKVCEIWSRFWQAASKEKALLMVDELGPAEREPGDTVRKVQATHLAGSSKRTAVSEGTKG